MNIDFELACQFYVSSCANQTICQYDQGLQLYRIDWTGAVLTEPINQVHY